MDAGTLNNSLNQENFILTTYMYHFSFRNDTLAKVLFINCFYIVVGKSMSFMSRRCDIMLWLLYI